MIQKFNSYMFGDYTRGQGTKGLRWLAILACLILFLQLRSLLF